MHSSSLSDLKKTTEVVESLSKTSNPMFCSREYQPTSRLNQQNEKSTSNFTTRVWVRGAALVLRLGKTSAEGIGLKNHRIFTLRCIHKDLVPVNIKLKTIKTDKAKKKVSKAERDLLQARVKAMNSILDNVGKQTVM